MNRKLAIVLANRIADVFESPGGKAGELATAHMRGVCVAAHAIGHGMTPTEVENVARDALLAVGTRPIIGSRGGHAWVESMTDKITAALS